ncbi:DNA-binding LacI/PurR family transcriptional regulator [Schumannella luteola]|uniref:DNA-binding LacI/PurR family transcriptional regulator n=1 Tax=Schumannella luteola TaxID=472059 RepID=A0A852YB31_9MICO|nr:LacI family DNA-binding transcriptional regulator [Schumannella luteola]NYG98504.1 DNA-binding LacI/PurR family transcriptional regulator [Schumannella luteola]
MTRRPTMRDVAAAAGVSHALVSLVYRTPEKVSEKRRQLVLDAAERLGFRPNWVASSLSGLKSYGSSFFGILVANLHNPVFATIVDAARAELGDSGSYGLMSSAVLPGPDGTTVTDERIVHAFEDLNVAGLLVVGVVPDLDVVRRVRPDLRIVVAAASIAELPRATSVRSDNDHGLRLLVEHLVAQGHSRIAHLGGAGGPASVSRAAGYERAMRELGLAEHIHVEPAGFTEESGQDAAARLIAERPDITAYTCVNDLVALGAMSAATAANRSVPGELAIAGYDNTYLAGIDRIDLTSVDTAGEEIGRTAARWLLADPAPEPGTETLIRPRLVVRGTTG